jgi:sulfur carrier protein ThiS
MQVSVTLWGNLRRFAAEGRGAATMQLGDGATIEDLMAAMGAEHEVYAAAVNGKVVPLSTRLMANDRISLFDHLHGG